MWKDDTSKPEEIQELEAQFRFRLFPLQEGDVLDFENRFCYQLDDEGKICGLNLALSGLADFDFLRSLTNLTSLDLSGDFFNNNEISDYSFLSSLTNLTSLDLSHNKISDGAFLSRLTNLTSLNLSGDFFNNNEISD